MSAFSTFEENARRAEALLKLYREVHGKRGQVPAKRADILRATVVFTVAAIDAYVREKISENVVPVVRRKADERELPKAMIQVIANTMETQDMLRAMFKKRPGAHIRRAVSGHLSKQSFQGPEAIDRAFEVLGISDAVNGTAKKLDQSAKSLRRELREFAKRRNDIVHQADLHQGKAKKGQVRRVTVKFIENGLRLAKRFVDALNQEVDGALAKGESYGPETVAQGGDAEGGPARREGPRSLPIRRPAEPGGHRGRAGGL